VRGLVFMPPVLVLLPRLVGDLGASDHDLWLWYVVLPNMVIVVGGLWLGVLDFRSHCAWYPLDRGWKGSLKPLLRLAWSDFFDMTKKDGVHLQ
jgi:hypothetical protein